MKRLYDEVLRRFPEVASYVYEGDEESPYLIVGYIADWLSSVGKPAFEPSVVQRVVDFDRRCMEQPRGETASDDIMTIEVVALREALFGHDELLPLVPKLMSRKQLIQNREYFVTWVGEDRYDAALRLFAAGATKGGKRGNPKPAKQSNVKRKSKRYSSSTGRPRPPTGNSSPRR